MNRWRGRCDDHCPNVRASAPHLGFAVRAARVHEVKNEHCRGKADCDQESDEEIRSHSKGALRRIVAKFGLERYCRVRCSRRLFVFCDLIDPSPKRVVSRRFRCRTSANRLAAAIKDFGFVSAPPQRQLIEPIASNPPSPNFRAHTGIVAWRCDVETATSAKSPAQIGAGPIGRQLTQSGSSGFGSEIAQQKSPAPLQKTLWLIQGSVS